LKGRVTAGKIKEKYKEIFNSAREKINY